MQSSLSKYGHSPRRMILAPLATAVVMAGTAFQALAASDTVDPALRQAMQRDLGLTASQVSQYLKVERLADQQQKALEKQQGRNFAGSWIERKADGSFQLVVGTTSFSQQKAAAGVEIRQAKHSFASLKASKAQLDDQLARGTKVPKGVYAWYVDVPSNTVVVSVGVGAEKAGIDFVARSGADANAVRFETMQEAPELRLAVQGGRGYLRDPGDGYLYACSVGFPVTQGSTLGFATAGHCGTAGEIVYNEASQWVLGVKIGTFAAASFPAPGGSGPDYAWVKVDNTHTLSPTVYGYGNGDVTVKGSTEAAVGAALCRSGRTSGWHCGAIAAKNVTVTYVSGETIQNLTRTTACSEGGDSGGSFITTSTGQAQGVLSGGSGSCKGKQGRDGGGNSYFQPINPILNAYNLTLKTG